MTTKICPQCGSDAVVALRSMDKKLCSDCKAEWPWKLDPGQKPLVASSRADRKQVVPDGI